MHEGRFQLQETISPIFRNLGCLCCIELYRANVPTGQTVIRGAFLETGHVVSFDLGSEMPNVDIPRRYIYEEIANLLFFNEHMKQNRPGTVFSTFYVRKYHQQELSAYSTLEHYLERTLPLRSSTCTKLLISYIKPFTPVSSSIIGTAIFKAHSTRSASVSKVTQLAPVYRHYS